MFPKVHPEYEILEELGRGSTGVVFKMRDKRIGRVAALKILIPKPGDEGIVRQQRFMREAQAIAACDHPNIARAFDIGEFEARHYIVREFVEGKTLQAELEKELLTTRQACKMVELLTRPVHYLHNQGIIHRNLTPENVLVAADGTVKLIGFGKATFIGGSESVATDIQALGAMLVLLITGRSWFPEGLSLLPAELAGICMKACTAHPENQYHSVAELAEDLRRYLRTA